MALFSVSAPSAYYIRRLVKRTLSEHSGSIPDLLLLTDPLCCCDLETRLQRIYADAGSCEHVVCHLVDLVRAHQQAKGNCDRAALQTIAAQILWWLGYGVVLPPLVPNVFVVDDTIETISLVSALLSVAGYRVNSALNGSLALKMLERVERPHLILLDIKLPDVDGFQIYHRLQTLVQLADIPVIFFSGLEATAHAQLDDIQTVRRRQGLGPCGYVQKPFKSDGFVDYVSHFLVWQRPVSYSVNEDFVNEDSEAGEEAVAALAERRQRSQVIS